MKQKDALSRVIRYTRIQLKIRGDRTINERSNFVNDLSADSLRSQGLVCEFEEQFGVKIPDADAQRIRTVGDAVKLIEWIRGGRRGENPLGVAVVDEGLGPLGTSSMSFADFGM